MSKIVLLIAALIFVLAGCGGGVNDGAAINVVPATASLLPGGQKQFSLDPGDLADWSAPDGGTVVNGLFTAPNSTGSFRVVATNVLNPFNSSTAVAHVSDVAVTLSPTLLSVAPGSFTPNAFTAAVAGSATKTVTWTVPNPVAGSIASGAPDANGNARANFTAGATPGTYTIQATSTADNTVSDVAQVQVLGNSSLGLNPRVITLSTTAPNNAVVLTAVLTDSQGQLDTTTALTWDVPLNFVNGVLSGSDPRQRTFTVPTSFVGVGTCQVRVRTLLGVAQLTTIQVVSG